MFIQEFDLETSLLEKNFDYAKKYIEEVQGPEVLKPSQVLARIFFRSNLNYLIGSYLTLLNTLPSYSYMGMRVVFETITRGYYYQCNEEAACASYLYIQTRIPNEESDDVNNNTLELAKQSITNLFLKDMCNKRINNTPYTETEKKRISDLDKPSRGFKKIIPRLYTKTRQHEMRSIYSSLSRYAHAGALGRFRDLYFQPDYAPSYLNNLQSIMLLLSANIIYYIEAFYENINPRLNYFSSLLNYLEAYPDFTPNKKEHQQNFKLKTMDELRANFLNRK